MNTSIRYSWQIAPSCLQVGGGGGRTRLERGAHVPVERVEHVHQRARVELEQALQSVPAGRERRAAAARAAATSQTPAAAADGAAADGAGRRAHCTAALEVLGDRLQRAARAEAHADADARRTRTACAARFLRRTRVPLRAF